ncbi:hypothetical protein F4680DRAFT_276459 [Xylaria scruposa]|nr:hypothetical protein F4680DRAFT_276459 [Xylaria scruposa]
MISGWIACVGGFLAPCFLPLLLLSVPRSCRPPTDCERVVGMSRKRREADFHVFGHAIRARLADNLVYIPACQLSLEGMIARIQSVGWPEFILWIRCHHC